MSDQGLVGKLLRPTIGWRGRTCHLGEANRHNPPEQPNLLQIWPCPPHHQAGPAPNLFLLLEVAHVLRHRCSRVSRPLMIPKWFGWAQGAGSSRARSTVNGQRLTRSDRAIGILTSSYPGCPTGTKSIGGLGAEIGGGEGVGDLGVFSPPHPHGFEPPYLRHPGSKPSALKCAV